MCQAYTCYILFCRLPACCNAFADNGAMKIQDTKKCGEMPTMSVSPHSGSFCMCLQHVKHYCADTAWQMPIPHEICRYRMTNAAYSVFRYLRMPHSEACHFHILSSFSIPEIFCIVVSRVGTSGNRSTLSMKPISYNRAFTPAGFPSTKSSE